MVPRYLDQIFRNVFTSNWLRIWTLNDKAKLLVLSVWDFYLLSDSFNARSHLGEDFAGICQRNAGVSMVFLDIVHHDSPVVATPLGSTRNT